ncbi:hypothetical protein [uncultured Phenylobacterium sp.]|uniref:hypothetical protein n=1 Tax=uncultured Phenylobacterium sp. TaxID=349273 RepID=UPI00260127DB|nr:hypothetical protein [uncultured Phenylobacterium sp.]
MARTKFVQFAPVFVAGLAGLALAGCSTYGARDYGYYGRSSPPASYSYGRGAIYTAPYGYDRGQSYSRRYSRGHNGFGHMGGRRH